MHHRHQGPRWLLVAGAAIGAATLGGLLRCASARRRACRRQHHAAHRSQPGRHATAEEA